MANIGPPTARCRICGKTGLRQRRGELRWTLLEADGREHACRRREDVLRLDYTSMKQPQPKRRKP